MSDDEKSVEAHLRDIQHRPDEQTATRRVPLSEASAQDHFEAIRSRRSYGPGGTVLTTDDPDTPDREDD